MVNVPGTIVQKNIYAIETAPSVGIEADPPGGLNYPVRYDLPNHPDWSLTLIDGDGGCNAFEATAKFTYAGVTKYYEGGVPGSFATNPSQVLTVFQSLSWVGFTPQGVCTVRQVVYTY
jgi:hypothetical protein